MYMIIIFMIVFCYFIIFPNTTILLETEHIPLNGFKSSYDKTDHRYWSPPLYLNNLQVLLHLGAIQCVTPMKNILIKKLRLCGLIMQYVS